MVKIGKFYFSTDFLVLDMEEDISVPFIFGRRFLAIGGANIDLFERKLTLRVGKEKEKFNVFEPFKYPLYEESCSFIAATDKLYDKKYVLEQDIGFMPCVIITHILRSRSGNAMLMRTVMLFCRHIN